MNKENYKESVKTFKAVDYDEDIENKCIVWDMPDKYNWCDTELYNMIETKLKGMVFK
jgi:predicted protein tyrosine phosphatase